MSKKVPVVVTLSGKMELEIDVEADMTVKDVMEQVVYEWNIDMNKVYQPFVVCADMIRGDHVVVEAKDKVEDVVKENGMLRVVLPLRPPLE